MRFLFFFFRVYDRHRVCNRDALNWFRSGNLHRLRFRTRDAHSSCIFREKTPDESQNSSYTRRKPIRLQGQIMQKKIERIRDEF